MSVIVRHLFVCQNERPADGKPSCGARGAGAVIQAVQKAIGENAALWGTVAVTPCGCLGPCFEGPMAVVYPEAIWYAGLTAGDAPQLVQEHLAGANPVERLRYHWPED